VLALEQRGQPGKGGLVMRPRSQAARRGPRKCSGLDVRGCARCAERRSGAPLPLLEAQIGGVEEIRMLAIEMHTRLKELQAERLVASSAGIAADIAYVAYMADLDDEIAEANDAYIGAAVTEIATLRAELFGPQVG
jgi:hypothetical protein